MASYGTLPTVAPGASGNGYDQDESDMAHWRVQLGHVLESSKVHWAVVLLTVLDAVCVLLQIFYTLFNECHVQGPASGAMPKGLVEAAEVLSMVITCLFVLELVLAFVSFGPKYYLPGWPHWKLHVLDAVVVGATFIFDIVLHGKEREMAELLIILRLWRVVRLVESAIMSANYANEEAVESAHKEIEDLKAECASLKQELEKERALRKSLEAQIQPE